MTLDLIRFFRWNTWRRKYMMIQYQLTTRPLVAVKWLIFNLNSIHLHEEFRASIIDALLLFRNASQNLYDNNQFCINAGNRYFEIRISICRFRDGFLASRILILPYFWINGTELVFSDCLLISEILLNHRNHDFSFFWPLPVSTFWPEMISPDKKYM